MFRSVRNCNVWACLCCLFLSCYTYRPIRLIKDVPLEFQHDAVETNEDGYNRLPRRGPVQTTKNRRRQVYLKKYFAIIIFPGPAAQINNRAVALARSGKFKSARILFEEAIREDPSMGAAYNNLGIVYEIFGERDKSFQLYARACMLEKNNEYFRKNFLYRMDDGHPQKN